MGNAITNCAHNFHMKLENPGSSSNSLVNIESARMLKHDQMSYIDNNASDNENWESEEIVAVIGEHQYAGQNTKQLKPFTRNSNTQIYSGINYTIFKDTEDCWIAGIVDSSQKHVITPKALQYFEKHNINIITICASIASKYTFWITDKGIYSEYITGNKRKTKLNPANTAFDSKSLQIVDIKCGNDTFIALCITEAMTRIILYHWCKFMYIPGHVIDSIVKFHNNYNDTANVYEAKVNSITNGDILWFKKSSSWKRQHFVSISAGAHHFLYLESNGTLWSSGDNTYGQMGTTTRIYNDNMRGTPVVVEYFVDIGVKIKQIECGINHSMVLDHNCKVYSWGITFEGQCGHGTRQNVKSPKRIEYLKEYSVVDIKCGCYHSCCIASDGAYYLFGSNGCNECITYDDHKCVLVPHRINDKIVVITNGKIIKSISLGNRNTKLVLY